MTMISPPVVHSREMTHRAIANQNGVDVSPVHHGRGFPPPGIVRLRGFQCRYFSF